MAKKTTTNNKKNPVQLEERSDLYNEWILLAWFTEKFKNAELKNLFLQLFMSIYDDLSEKFSGKKRDEIFLQFINQEFPNALDEYKWLESEKERHDIGLLNALHQVAVCSWYIELLTKYSKKYNPK